MPSFHVLIATTGRPSLQNMLESLIPQLRACDHISIVFDDAKAEDSPFVRKIQESATSVCKIHIHEQSPKLGSWGHGIRNEYAKRLERTDFVMHADDDDTYVENAFDKLRSLCKRNLCLYIAKMNRRGIVFPMYDYIKEGEIGTPCGIIPYDLNPLGTWLPRVGGDGKFYEAISRKAKFVNMLSICIYNAN